MKEIILDILAAIGALLNVLPQGVMALNLGFAPMSTAIGIAFYLVFFIYNRAVVPVTFQVEALVALKKMGSNSKERVAIIFLSSILLLILSILEVTNKIIDFAGELVLNGMMAGIGLLLLYLSFELISNSKKVSIISIVTAVLTYITSKGNLVMTVVISIVISSAYSYLFLFEKKQKSNEENQLNNELKIIKLSDLFDYKIIYKAIGFTFLTMGTNMAYGNITSDLAGKTLDIKELGISMSLSNIISSFFGGAPLNTFISATGSAPNPYLSGLIFMGLILMFLVFKLIPRIVKYIDKNSIAGFLCILSLFLILPEATSVLSNYSSYVNILVFLVVAILTFKFDPLLGVLSGVVLNLFFQ